MRYIPAGDVGSSCIDPPAVPPEILQEEVDNAGNPVIVQGPVSPPLNPKPDTPTEVPGKATLGESVT
jgi:hypothetical protein